VLGLGAASTSVVIAIAVFVWIAVLRALKGSRPNWNLAEGVALLVFVTLFAAQVPVYLLIAARAWGGPVQLERIRHQPTQPRTVYKDRLVTVNGHNSRHQEPPKTLQERMADTRNWIAEQARSFQKNAHRKALPQGRQRFVQQTQRVSAKVETPPIEEESLLEEIFRITHEMYSTDLTRPAFEERYEGGQNLYAKYKAIWKQMGWVGEKGNGKMYWLYDEKDLYRHVRALRTIAERNGFEY